MKRDQVHDEQRTPHMLTKDEQKAVFREVIKEFLVEQSALFGVFSAKTLVVSIFCAVCYLYFSSKGWVK